MFVSDCLNVNEAGHLTIGGVDTVKLAETYGTPLYVMDEDQIRANCKKYKASFETEYGGNGMPTFASKAFCCKEICRIVESEGLGLDVVSGGELYTALSAGFPAPRIHFHGNNKTPSEIEYALDAGVDCVIADNRAELELLNQIAGELGKKARIGLRIKPGIDAHTHAFVKTGQIDSKFGFALETGEAMEAVKRALALPHLELRGVHCHIGSQIFDIAPFEEAARVMLGFLAQIKDACGVELPELNLGGGFGIQYTDADTPPDYGAYTGRVAKIIRETCEALSLATPKLFMEPGRSIVGEAGITLYKVGAVKEIPGVRTYVSVDGGMTDNPRYALYKSDYTVLLANKAEAPKDAVVTVAGRCCESGDLIQEHAPLQEAQAGDLLAVLSTGAYNYSMASNYNRVPRPPVIMVRNGEARVVVRRETFEDMARYDV